MYNYQRLKDLREDKDLYQKDIAKIINTTANYYGDYENGKRDIPTSRMIMLADYYEVSMDYITGRTNDKGGLHKNNKEEQELLNLFNKLSIKNKWRIIERIEMLLEEDNKENSQIKSEDNIKIKQRDYGTVNINK